MAAALWILSGVWYVMAECVVAQHVPGYRYATNYISDLGRPLQSPMAAWMNGAFISQGVAFALAAALIVAAMRPGRGAVSFVGFALVYGAGSVVVGVVPSGGPGALVHLGAATAAILAGNAAVLTAGTALLHRRRSFGLITGVLGVAGLLSGAVLLFSSIFGARMVFDNGAWERAAIYTIIGWQLLAGATVLITFRQPQRAADSEAEPPARP